MLTSRHDGRQLMEKWTKTEGAYSLNHEIQILIRSPCVPSIIIKDMPGICARHKEVTEQIIQVMIRSLRPFPTKFPHFLHSLRLLPLTRLSEPHRQAW